MKLARLRRALAVVVVIVLVVATIAAVQAAINKGDKAPAFKLSSAAGKTVSMDQLREDPSKKGQKRVVLMEFGAAT
jgi:hypothetical protein